MRAARVFLVKGVRFAPVASPSEAMVVSLQQGAESMEMR